MEKDKTKKEFCIYVRNGRGKPYILSSYPTFREASNALSTTSRREVGYFMLIMTFMIINIHQIYRENIFVFYNEVLQNGKSMSHFVVQLQKIKTKK